MKLQLNPGITFEALEHNLTQKLPQYTIKKLKNPIARFEYIEVKKSGTVGVWIRIIEKKQQVLLINCMPSAFARAMLGLIFILFFIGGQNKLRKEVGEIIKQDFNTGEI